MNNTNVVELLPIYTEYMVENVISDTNQVRKEGSFLKQILILLQHDDVTEDNKAMLLKILQSCKLSIADCFIIEASEGQAFSYINDLKPSHVLLFGFTLTNSSFCIHKDFYKPFRFNQKVFLLSDSLEIIKNNVTLKNSLWNKGLKPMFKID